MNNNVAQLVRSNIQNLVPYSSAREEHTGNNGIFLDANENPFGEYNRYPDPYQSALKKRLAEIKRVRPEQIFLGNGSDEIIDIAFRIFCEPRIDKALIFTPTYGMYEVAAEINAVGLIKVNLDAHFQIDREGLLSYMNDSSLKLMFICSPNNPTGNLLNKDDIEFILGNFKGIVIIDEAYIDFSGQTSFAEKIDDYPNLIVCQTLSKAWGLAGIRLGIAVMNPLTLSYYNKVKAPYNISNPNQQIALDALNDISLYQERVGQLLEEKQKLCQQLASLKMVRKIYPSDANFLLVEVDNADTLYRLLAAQQIIIRNRNKAVKNCVRITVGTPEENQQLITVLTAISNA